MPNRILREGILTSERVAMLNWAEEVFYRRLMSVVDDFGRYHANPKLIRAACYPLLIDKVSDADVGKWLTSCVTAALVSVYPAQDGKRYLQMLDFRQQTRAEKSKFPPMPDGCLADAQQMHTTCESPAHLDVFGGEGGCGDVSSAPQVVPRGGLFPIFWATYPRKEGRPPSEKAFDKIKPDMALLEIMLAAIKTQAQSERWRKDGGQYIPMPATWLNQRRWEDQMHVDVAPGGHEDRSAKFVGGI